MKWNDESVRTRLDEAWERGYDDGQAYPDSVPCPYDHIVKSDGFVCGTSLPECPECGRLASSEDTDELMDGNHPPFSMTCSDCGARFSVSVNRSMVYESRIDSEDEDLDDGMDADDGQVGLAVEAAYHDGLNARVCHDVLGLDSVNPYSGDEWSDWLEKFRRGRAFDTTPHCAYCGKKMAHEPDFSSPALSSDEDEVPADVFGDGYKVVNEVTPTVMASCGNCGRNFIVDWNERDVFLTRIHSKVAA